MDGKSKISVVIPNYNRGRQVLECIASIEKSSLTPDEIIVVDDCSTDDSVDVLGLQNIKLIKHSENKGTAAARNTGVRNSKGEIIVFIDSDVVIHEDTIRKCVDVFKGDETISVIVGLPDKTNRYQGVCTGHFLMRVYFRLFSYSSYISYTNGSLTAVRRSTFKKVGGYSERLAVPGTEDAQFGRDICRINEKVYLDKSNVVTHNKEIHFWGLIKNDMTRTVARVFYLFRGKMVGTALKNKRFLSTSISQIVSALLAPLNLIFLVLTAFSPVFLLPLIASLVLFFFLNYGYLIFVMKERGLTFALKVYLLLIVDMFFVHLAFWKGSLLYMTGRRY